MKKTYSKPQIMFENFALSTNIAGDCEGIVGNPAKGTCGIISTGVGIVFDNTISQCNWKPTDLGYGEDDYNGDCYHVPTELHNLFNS